jgi:signal transduction histidine kinase/CheY-like chemotaxis protein/HPt (histidine-containing phosphotransfer) domain-containing protein
MRTMLRRSLLLLLLTTAGQLGASTLTIANLEEPRSITGEWRFKTGDDMNWAEPQHDDSGWQPVIVPATSPVGHPGHTGIAWYRLRLRFDPADPVLRAGLGVEIGSIESAYEVYAGGSKLGGRGKLPPQAEVQYDRYAVYPVPAAAVAANGELVLALRVWRYEGAPMRHESGPFAGPYRVGEIGALRAAATASAIIPNVLLAAVYLMIGLYHLLIARRNPQLKEFYWFGWLAVILGIYSFETSQWKYALDLPFLVHKKVEYLALYLGPPVIMETFARIARIRLTWIGRAVQAVFVAFAVVMLVVPSIDIHYLTLPWFQYLAALWTLGIAILLGWHAFHGNREARSLTVLMVLFFMATLFDVILRINPLGGNNLLHLVFALVVLLMAVLMANRYTETLAKLERTVEEHTADLREANLRLEQASAAKSQFLANMSHELRTPMNAIIGLSQLGLKTELSDQQRGYLTTVEHSAQGLLGIIESILDYSDLDAGTLILDEEPFSLAELLEHQAAIAGHTAEDKGLALSFAAADDLPPLLVGDARRLGQVLAILVGNAIKFTEAGAVDVSVTLRGAGDESASIDFAVTDTGPGMDETQQRQLFDAFTQADDSHTREHGGTGLGLAVAAKLTRLMEGDLSVDSTPGQGSTFRLAVTLPLADPAETTVGGQSLEHGELDLAPIQGARVLLVDDSDINLQVAGEILRQVPLHVDTASDGAEAVAMVEAGSYDCVLMDIQMPVMDGYTATEKIRARPGSADLPILAMTANVLPEDRERAKAVGMNAHIAKPVDPEVLHRELLNWIEPGEREAIEAAPAVEAISPGELPESLPGISIAEGLSRVGGNAKLYISLLNDLARHYADCATQLGDLAAAGDLEEAAALAHKLKGIANNLGAGDVGGRAAAIESTLRTGNPPGSETLAALGEALSVASGSANQLQAATEPAGGEERLEDAAVIALLDQLEQEIGENNPVAGETAESLLAGIGEDSAAAAAVSAARDALDMFDFASAGGHLAEARAALS